MILFDQTVNAPFDVIFKLLLYQLQLFERFTTGCKSEIPGIVCKRKLSLG